MKRDSLDYVLSQKLLTFAINYLPKHARDETLQDWLTELYDASQDGFSPLLKAVELTLTIPQLAWTERGALGLVPIQQKSRLDRILHTYSKVMIVFLTVMLLAADALAIFLLPGSNVGGTILILFGFNILLAGYYAVVFKGAYFDIPWMRVTRLASFIKLSIILIGISAILTGLASSIFTMLWASIFAIYVPWEIYWDIKKPYYKYNLFRKD